jgi:hypothetical protein
MTPFAAVAVKTIGAGAVAALLGVGAVSAASPSPSPAATPDKHGTRHAVAMAVVEAEADVLGIKPEELRKDLKDGQKVSDLAKAKGMNEQQFAARLVVNLKPRLAALVDHHQLTQARADRILDRIAKGKVPFWDGIHRRK